MLDVQRVHDACNPAASADLAALLITDGLANLLLVGAACTVSKAKVEHSLPRKRGAAAAGYEKAVSRFFTKVGSFCGGILGTQGAHAYVLCCTTLCCCPATCPGNR